VLTIASASLALVDLGTSPSGHADTGELPVTGELVFAGPVPPSTATDALTLKRLRFTIPSFRLSLSDGTTLQVDDAVLRVSAPIALARRISFYTLSGASTEVSTCATIDGRAWHGTSSLAPTGEFGLPGPDGSVTFEGTFPLTLRADDATCSPIVISASIQALFTPDRAGDAS
jgi:hypothetical protein